jgi:hypothetical protein
MHDSENYLAFDHSIFLKNIINVLWVFVISVIIHLKNYLKKLIVHFIILLTLVIFSLCEKYILQIK